MRPTSSRRSSKRRAPRLSCSRETAPHVPAVRSRRRADSWMHGGWPSASHEAGAEKRGSPLKQALPRAVASHLRLCASVQPMCTCTAARTCTAPPWPAPGDLRTLPQHLPGAVSLISPFLHHGLLTPLPHRERARPIHGSRPRGAEAAEPQRRSRPVYGLLSPPCTQPASPRRRQRDGRGARRRESLNSERTLYASELL